VFVAICEPLNDPAAVRRQPAGRSFVGRPLKVPFFGLYCPFALLAGGGMRTEAGGIEVFSAINFLKR
jgi:hypothetical protein